MPHPQALADDVDSRHDPRTVVRRCGWLSRTKGEQLRECIVWDESAAGACLMASDTGEIPDDFYIYMSLEFTSRRRCRVAWRTDKLLGVRFVE